MPETEDYRIAVTLLADPRPSVVKWRDPAISGALMTEAAQPRTGQTDSVLDGTEDDDDNSDKGMPRRCSSYHVRRQGVGRNERQPKRKQKG
jgi:hypothetical protein